MREASMIGLKESTDVVARSLVSLVDSDAVTDDF